MTHPFDLSDTIQMKGALTGVTRLSRKAKFLIFLVSFLVFGYVIISIVSMNSGTDTTETQERAAVDPERNAKNLAFQLAKPPFAGIDDGQAGINMHTRTTSANAQAGSVDRSLDEAIDAQVNVSGAATQNSANPHTQVRLPPSSASAGGPDASQYQTPEEQAAAQERKEKADREQNAIRSSLDFGMSDSSDALSRVEQTDTKASISQNQTGARAAAQEGEASPFIPALTQQQDDQNKQIRKEHFLRMSDTTPKTYLKELKQPPISPFELKAGWAIPAALECGLNSDLPGQTCARVTENVYDTATGRYLLIPQGTKVIGTYDSQIAYGQQRILAIWNRLIFPDASSMSLDGMPGEDKAGNAGFDANVNNHYLKVFGSALLMATFSAGIELTQKQNATLNGMPTNSQMISQSLGQQLGQTGAAYIQRGMNIQPTLTRAPGYKFTIIVTRDMVFPSAYKPQSPSVN